MPPDMVLINKADLAVLVCKINRYERFLHDLQLYAEVAMNSDKVRQLIANACRWSYAHRAGNGEISDEDQEDMIFRAFQRLCEIKKD